MKAIIAIAALALAFCGPAQAAKRDPDAKARTEVLATLDRFFVAMSARDANAWSELLLDDAIMHSQNVGPDGQATLRSLTGKEMIAGLGGGPPKAERVWKPKVLVRGPIAVVWAPYEFRLDGKSHHCGIDVFDFVKVNGAWKISGALWTAEPAACPELKAAN